MKKTNKILLVLASSVLLTGCLTSNQSIRTLRFNADNVDDFTITTDLSSEKVIHTDQQAEYLAYEGEYVSIPEANYPDGQQHLSDPNPVNLAWEFNVPSGKTVARYDVITSKNPDLMDSYTVKGTDQPNLDIYNSYLGDNYFKVVANYTDGTTDSSRIQKYKVENVYPRNLKIDGMTNCRDMGGGRVLENGGTIRQGLLYRTSGTHSWGNGKAKVPDTITNDGKLELLNHLNCKTEINVNNSGSNQVGVENYVEAYMWYDGGKHHLYRNAEPLKEVFHALANPDNYPIFYHCRIGTDRTGLCAIMISGLLGVPKNLIFQDYLFSNFGNIQEKRYIGDKAGRDNILNYIEDLEAMPGEKFQNKVYNYLLSIGVPASELDSIIDILVEGDKPSGNNNLQETILANEFEPDGCELKTNEADRTKHANPSAYFTLGQYDAVKATFNPKYNGQGKLVAYLGSSDSSDSKKINEAITATLDGNQVEISDDITFSSAGFGSGANRTYYTAVILGDVDVVAGPTEVVIEGQKDNLNIAALTLIPTEQQNVEPEVEPAAPSKGCGGSIVMTTSLISLVALSGLGFFLFKRKEN